MGVAGGIQHDSVGVETDLLQFVDERSLVVTLKIMEPAMRKTLLQFTEKIVKTPAAIYLWFADTQKIEIWTVENIDVLHFLLVSHVTDKLNTHQLNFLNCNIILR